jgi:hypothetical protein
VKALNFSTNHTGDTIFMSKNGYWLFALLMMGLLSPPTLTANAPSDSGSKEALKETAIRYTDTFTNKEFMVFESVGNEGYEKEKQFSKMTFYVAPLFRLIPDPETQAVYQKTPYAHRGTVQYTFFVECFPPRIEEQALKKVNKYYSKTKGEYVFTEEQVHHMRHGKVVIKAANLPAWVKIEPVVIGTDAPNSTVMLDAVEEFTVEVPLDMDKDFQTRLDSGMKFKFVVYFNVMNLSRLTLSWSVEDIRQTSTYKQINSSGAHYVTAEQVHNITRQVAEKRNVYYYQDPGIDDKIVEKALSLFDKVRGDMQALSVQNRQQATELEAKLREGTGLSPSEFKPLTLMWDVYEKLETVDDHKTANKVIRDAYQRNKQAYQKLDDVYQRRQNTASRSSSQRHRDKSSSNQLNINAGFDYDVSLTEGEGSMYYNHNYQDAESLREGSAASSQGKSDDNITRKRERSNTAEDRINKGYFENAEALTTYKDKTTEQKRPEVKIVGRGLNVIEKSQFEQNINSMASFVFVQPMTQAKSFTTDDNISTHSKNDVSSPKRDVFSMLEPLKQELSEKMREINQLREQANRNATQIANLRQLGDQANRNATQIANLRQSDTQQDRQINAFQSQMNRSARQVTKLTDAVSVNNGKVGIGTTNPMPEHGGIALDVNGHLVTRGFVSFYSINNPKRRITLNMNDPAYAKIYYYDESSKQMMNMSFGGGSNIGIGTDSPQYKLDVKGQIRADNVAISSDERYKQNIQTLGSSLAKLAQVRGVRFNWKDNPEDEQIGLVAQEVEKVFPELVSTDSEGYKSIAYGKLTAVLIEAIKELQQQNEIMAQQIRALGASAD